MSALALSGVGAVPPPARADFDISALSCPASLFTGDFYFSARRSSGLWFVLGDVAGKGIDSAVLMGLVMEEIERMVDLGVPSVASLIDELHRSLRPELPPNRFVTLTAGRVDAEGGLEIVNAGHPPSLIVHQSGKVEPVVATGPVVGILCCSRWATRLLRLDEKATLFLYSDGLLEALSPDEEEFGFDRIRATLARGRHLDANGLTSLVYEAVASHRAGRAPNDDLTLMALRR
ncbi:MAG TPA: PP2C family protein-serine/threonine phosphatase [Thermoanaerobaculia bacterium]|nr:PP2C family protein-serine/threonine phosphatase [Thermoanaerobaculia bacterium]